jgi:hypothetical protein
MYVNLTKKNFISKFGSNWSPEQHPQVLYYRFEWPCIATKEWWFGKMQLWNNRGIILALAWRDWGNPRKTSLRISNVPAESRTEHIPDKSQERQLLKKFPTFYGRFIMVFITHPSLYPTLNRFTLVHTLKTNFCKLRLGNYIRPPISH